MLEYKNHFIKIETDDNPENPREWDNAGTMVCWHKRYNLGDKHNFESPDEFLDWWQVNGKGGILLNLYLFDHSGITIRTSSFNDRWDSGQVGYYYITKEQIKAEQFKNLNNAEECLEGEVEVYDKYLTGQFCGYSIYETDEEESDIIDSVWGYDDADFAEQAAKESIDYHIANTYHQLPILEMEEK